MSSKTDLGPCLVPPQSFVSCTGSLLGLPTGVPEVNPVTGGGGDGVFFGSVSSGL